MNGFAKGVVGALGASLLAWGAHHMTGAEYIDGLETKGKEALSGGGFDEVSFEMQRDPLARIAVLGGVDDPAERAKVEAALAAKGITNVRWVGDDAGAGEGEAVVSEEVIATCQDGVNAIVAEKEINFRSGSAYLPDRSMAVVKEVAEALAPCDGATLAVGGHTDATGSAEVNQNLSQARADAVKAALVESGLGADSISATGYGSSQPKVEGDGANEANRRIEFTLGTGADSDSSEEGE